MLDKLFKLSEKGTTVKTEILAGVTTFLAMAYILAVNPAMLGETGMSVQGVFLATAIASAVATIIMGLVANYPVALSAGMGVNALFHLNQLGLLLVRMLYLLIQFVLEWGYLTKEP